MTYALVQFKDGVEVIFNQYINAMLAALSRGFAKHGYNVVTITAGRDGKHMPESYHAKNRALDVRSRDVHPDVLQPLAATIRSFLPTFYDVVVEGDHYHIEADAKKESKK